MSRGILHEQIWTLSCIQTDILLKETAKSNVETGVQSVTFRNTITSRETRNVIMSQ